MLNLVQHPSILRMGSRAAGLALAVAVMPAITVTQSAQAQTYHVLYSFSGGRDGGQPYAGLVRDSVGISYGTTMSGGGSNYGTVFEVDTRSFPLGKVCLCPSE
jgi:hypothetical protein